MAGTEARVVWVLGAGFSRPLGGPTLQSLLTSSSLSELRSLYEAKAGQLNDPIYDAVTNAYLYGHQSKLGRPSGWPYGEGDSLWGDAEEFLECCDRALEQGMGPAAARLDRVLEMTGSRPRFGRDVAETKWDQLADAARRLLALECAAFLEDADLGSERWMPYCRWLSDLVGENDSIVTFNYDRVLELAHDHVFAGHSPKCDFGPNFAGSGRPPVRVLKLHGSVDWYLDTQRNRVVAAVPSEPPYMGIELKPLIAAPGPSKMKLCRAALASQWRLATEAISTATAIAFVGYRFPPTDSHSLASILEAIGENGQETLVVHVVLGSSRDDAQRLRRLVEKGFSRNGRWPTLRTVAPGAKNGFVWVHDLFAQDFCTTMPRRLVEKPTAYEASELR